MRIAINHERAGIIFFKGGYHAYWIRYSNGLKYINDKYKNMWCKPKFEKCDLRPLIKNGIVGHL